MPRYIDAEDLVKRMKPQDMLDANDIAEFQTADVVPVVRCKDCQHYVINGCDDGCDHHFDGAEGYYPVQPDDFCSYGERREETCRENCAECKHHSVFWGDSGCNLLNNNERCKFEPRNRRADDGKIDEH